MNRQPFILCETERLRHNTLFCFASSRHASVVALARFNVIGTFQRPLVTLATHVGLKASQC